MGPIQAASDSREETRDAIFSGPRRHLLIDDGNIVDLRHLSFVSRYIDMINLI